MNPSASTRNEPGERTLFLPLEKIRAEYATQSRVEISMEVVHDYEELYRDQSPQRRELPPPIVYHDGVDYWLADGFQRRLAAMRAGMKALACIVRPGGFREARLHAASSNAGYGLRRTRADERRAVNFVLQDEEGKHWPAEKVAQHCAVSLSLVLALKMSTPFTPPPGLYGPDDLAKPPQPDFALADRRTLEAKARRAARKYLRFCERMGVSADAFLAEIAREVEEARLRGRKKIAESADAETESP